MRCLMVLAASLAVVFVGVSAAAPAAQGRWVITDLGALPGDRASEARAINERGQVVGWSSRVSEREALLEDRHQEKRAFLWQKGKMRDLRVRTSEDYHLEINDRGQVIGDNADTDHAFLWQNGKLRDLGTLGGEWSVAQAINERGQVVGESQTKAGRHAFLWQNGKMRDLGTLGGRESHAFAINDRGQIVGQSKTKSGAWHAFLWQNGKMRDLGTLGGAESSAGDINERGQVVGNSSTRAKDDDGDPIRHAFLWQNGKMTDIGARAREYNSYAALINDRGQVVGDLIDIYGMAMEGSAFLWRDGKLTRLPLWGPILSAMNERGQIVGMNNFGDSHDPVLHGFLWNRGKLIDLGARSATDINERGQIVGYNRAHAVLWTYKP